MTFLHFAKEIKNISSYFEYTVFFYNYNNWYVNDKINPKISIYR